MLSFMDVLVFSSMYIVGTIIFFSAVIILNRKTKGEEE